MARLYKRRKLWMKVLRYVMTLFFSCGFVYQTFQFLFLYWTYPTVVDIQQSSPTYVEIPAFTFCNRIGYRFENLCKGFDASPCATNFFHPVLGEILCKVYPAVCENGTYPKDGEVIKHNLEILWTVNKSEKFSWSFSLRSQKEIIFYSNFMEEYSLKREDFKKFAVSLEEYLNCTIEYAGNVTLCNMENVLGSFYTLDDFPQFCYTIYSKWGQPHKKRELIPRGATMKFSLFLNISRRAASENDEWLPPLFNPMCDPAAQIAVHSPYFLPSPYFAGTSFLGGRAYELRIKLSERHLLPYPYQTNCTDYMTNWYARNGKAPVNQLSTIQECRINKTIEKLGCIPVLMDYPHPYNICKTCSVVEIDNCPYAEPPNNCSTLGDSFNQACDSLTYTVNKENKAIVLIKKPDTFLLADSDGIRLVLPMHDCEGRNIWRPECSTIKIDVPFDQFEITNITYNPKFESLELFSVIGGYMGMWLGISLLTVHDIIIDCFLFLRSYFIKRSRRKMKVTKMVKVPKESVKFKEYNTVYRSW